MKHLMVDHFNPRMNNLHKKSQRFTSNETLTFLCCLLSIPEVKENMEYSFSHVSFLSF